MTKQYQYNFAPKGDHAQEVTTWLKSQSDRSASLKIAILKMIKTYGSTTDLKDLMLQRFVSDTNSAPASIPTAKSIPATVHTQPQLPTGPDKTDIISATTNAQMDMSKPELVSQPASQVNQPASASSEPSSRSESHRTHEHDARPIPRHSENKSNDDSPNFNFLSQRH